MARGKGTAQKHHNNNGATIGIEAKLRVSTDTLRNHAA